MLFKDERFRFMAELVDAAPVANAIVGGAVRDEIAGRSIKDFDIIVHAEDATDLLNYFVQAGFDVIESMGHEYEQTEDKHLTATYDNWYRLGLEHPEFEDFTIDMLILRLGIYKREQGVAPSRNFKTVVNGFDNTMNHWMYYAGSVVYLGGQAGAKYARQCRLVTEARLEHIKEIAQDIGWTYVPLGAE